MAAQGRLSQDIAAELDVSRPTVQLWRQRFLALRLARLEKDAPRPGRVPRISPPTVRAVVEATLHSKPPDATPWSTRTMAKAQGVSEASVRRIWKQHNLKPHRTKTFKLSRDPQFVEKLQDVVGLYLNPPEKALVLCVDEKTQIQALDRTQPGLPMKPGRCGTFTHDYKRHGATTLFAALNLLDGEVIGDCMPHHRRQEFIRFLKTIDQETPPGLNPHIIIDKLRRAQTSAGAIVVATPSALPPPLHPDFQFLAESCRTVVRPPDPETYSPWQFPQRPGSDRGHL